MIKFNVTNRWSGNVQFTAEIDCAENAPFYIKMGLAVRWAIGTHANLRGANLTGADLTGTDLTGADLTGAVLTGAVLRGADLTGAVLRDAKIKDLALLGYPDGWSAWTYITSAGIQRVQVGCRNMTIMEGRAYWMGKDNRREVMAALDYAEAIANVRGWMTENAEAA